VLYNLVDNAAKFSPKGSPITISTTDNNKQVIISVTDCGIGIPENEQLKIFDRFYHVKPIDGKREKSTGLGLAICKRIVEQHKGKIWVESCLGKGSTFFFSLPTCTG
jgi:two-component system sensor histidine kinase VicK